MAVIEMRFGPCLGAFHHSEVIDADDDRFDATVMGLPLKELEPPGQHGYCARCGQGFHWNVQLHRWVDRNYPVTSSRRKLMSGHISELIHGHIYPIIVPNLLPPEHPEWLTT